MQPSFEEAEVVIDESLTVFMRTYQFNGGGEVSSNEGRKRKSLVCWGHGLDSSMKNEDAEKLWNFWDKSSSFREAAGPCRHAVTVARYMARGHIGSSAASTPDQCTWPQLGKDMLEFAAQMSATDHHPYDTVILGGSSMGAASTIHAAVSLLRTSKEDALNIPKLAGIVLVIPPTCYETRTERGAALVNAASRSYDINAPRRPRSLFPGHEPAVVGHNIRPDSYKNVMEGVGISDFPSRDVVKDVLKDVPTLVLSWDCQDRTHPVSTAKELESLLPHATIHITRNLQELQTWPERIVSFIINCIGDEKRLQGKI